MVVAVEFEAMELSEQQAKHRIFHLGLLLGVNLEFILEGITNVHRLGIRELQGSSTHLASFDVTEL